MTKMSELIFSRNFTLSEIDEVSKVFMLMLEGKEIVLLSGDLGSGKTTFIAALLRHFLIFDVTSPSYILEQEYFTKNLNIDVINHWDLYRTSSVPEELLEPPSSRQVILIEWGEKFEFLLNSFSYWLKLSIIDQQERKIEIYKRSYHS